MPATTVMLRHRRVELALHRLDIDGDDGRRPLLILHGLGEHTREHVPVWARGWAGPVWGLDFTGHGASSVPAGGGYTAEALLGDADAALGELGPLTVAGRGLGAYIALLLAGGRATDIHGAVLADGPGLAGGGPRPSTPYLGVITPSATTPDPRAMADLSVDIRPPDYAANFARLATMFSPVDPPITVAARSRPAWLQAVVEETGVRLGSLEDGLRASGG